MVWGKSVGVFWWWGAVNCLICCEYVVAGNVLCVFFLTHGFVCYPTFVGVCVSFRPVSTSSLNLLLGVQVWPINPVVCGGPYPSKRVRSLVLEEVSRLDAFSGYPVRT